MHGGGGVCARRLVLFWFLLLIGGVPMLPVAVAEDGYDLWLRYQPIEEPWATRYRKALKRFVAGGRLVPAVRPVAGSRLLRSLPARAMQPCRPARGRDAHPVPTQRPAEQPRFSFV